MSQTTNNQWLHEVKLLPVDTVEQGVFNPPEGMVGWRAYRLEYGGHAEDCVVEGMIWLPASGDPDAIVNLINGMQAHEQIWTKI